MNTPTLSRLLPYPLVLLSVVLALGLTMPPSIFTADSPELVLGALTLGIVHSPGYPLYLLVAHLFTQLPFDDPAYAVNWFSALSLAGASLFIFDALRRLLHDRLIALAVALCFPFSFYIWTIGIIAEVYAPHLLLLSVLGWGLAVVFTSDAPPTPRQALGLGAAYGLTTAMNPISVLFAPGMMAAFRALRISWRWSLLSATLALLIFGASLLYFPWRAAADPSLHSIGLYDSQGVFQPVDVGTPAGLWDTLRGAQFEAFFFADGYLPTLSRLSNWLEWLWGNFLGFGLVLGLIGLYALFRAKPTLLLVWAVWYVPYIYFYMLYGADDRDSMFGPSYWLWLLPMGYGLRWLAYEFEVRQVRYLALALPIALLLVNFSLVNVRDSDPMRERAEAIMAATPQDSAVFGLWADVMAIQYLQHVEEQRPDINTYNLFFFDTATPLLETTAHLLAEDQAVIYVDLATEDYFFAYDYRTEVLIDGEIGDENGPPYVVRLRPSLAP